MHKVSEKIKTNILELNKVPLNKRAADFRIAKGLLEEAINLIKINDYLGAETIRKAAEPYIRFSELL